MRYDLADGWPGSISTTHHTFHFPGDGDDQDKTYEPESTENDSSDEEQLANVESAEIERPRKRQCKEGMWKRKRASTLRNSGLEYKDRKGRLHAAKKTTEYVHQCSFGGIKVCKKFFVKPLDISNRRLDYVVQKKLQSTGAGVSPKDLRGKAIPGPSHHVFSRRQAGREGIIVEKEAEELLERLVDGNVSELSDLDEEND
ncbi:hypothetical protein J6590_089187 [Homalodisca vitripennis]|nr:hypothetical protein J6590_089187 [Homalodisca vitripennis]